MILLTGAPLIFKYKSLYNLWQLTWDLELRKLRGLQKKITLYVQGGSFNWSPPKFSKYKIPL